MFGWLRKFFRKPKPPTPEEIDAAIRRGKEVLPCCGRERAYHVEYRSGALKCPGKWELPEDQKNATRKLDLRYDPLKVDYCFYPPWAELQFPCDRCRCPRGIHAFREDGERGPCRDPDCPGCPKGLEFS
jgi:hypothetical protein